MTLISLSVGQRVVIAFAFLMLLWYVVGTSYNRRRSIRSLNWLRQGMSSLGGQLQASWIGTAASGARVVVNQAEPPFRQLEVTFLLASRELLPVWLVNLLQGKRDEIVIRADLRSPRQGLVEVLLPGSRLDRSLRQDSRTPWRWVDGPHGLLVAYQGAQGEELFAAMMPFLQAYGLSLCRLSCRKGQPQVLIHARLAGLIRQSSAGFFHDLAAAFNHPPRTTGSE